MLVCHNLIMEIHDNSRMFVLFFQCCVEKGFAYHFVKNNKLILSRWLPNGVASKLPLGPTHQVGVGTVVFHPSDPSQMLVVQEKTGPGKN